MANRGRPVKMLQDLKSIITKAIVDERTSIDYNTASFAESRYSLSEFSCPPRDYVAKRGIPDLSDILDVSELERSISPPLAQKQLGTARSFRAPSYVGTDTETDSSTGNEDSDLPNGDIKLSAQAERRVDFTPCGNDHDSFSSNQITRKRAIDEPLAPELSTALASSFNFTGQDVPATEHRRLEAPTPSKWARLDVESPTCADGIRPTTRSLSKDSPNAATTFPTWSSPVVLPSSVSAQNFRDISFGTTSPSFKGSTQNPIAEALASRRRACEDRAHRRRSEPLLRSCLKKQTSRRSTSPLRFPLADDTFHVSVDSGVSTPSHRQRRGMSDSGACCKEAVFTPESASDGNTTTVTDKTPGPEHWGLLVNVDSGTSRADAETPLKGRGVFKIDMRRNPNIWGKRQTPSRVSKALGASGTPGPSGSDTIQNLAEITERYCDGLASVAVHQENGRLVVRFKLSSEYAHLFPCSQGADESRFTTTPCAISGSPPLNFSGHSIDNQRSRPLCASAAAGVTPPMLSSPSISSLPSFSNFSCLWDAPSVLHDSALERTRFAESIAGPATTNHSDQTRMSVPFSPIYNDLATPTPGSEEPSSAREAPHKTAVRETETTIGNFSSLVDLDHTVGVAEPVRISEELAKSSPAVRPTAASSPSSQQLFREASEPKETVSTAANNHATAAVDVVRQPFDPASQPPALQTPGRGHVAVAGEVAAPRRPVSLSPMNKTTPMNTESAALPADEKTEMAKSDGESADATAPNCDAPTESHVSRPCRQLDYDSPGRDYMRDFIKRSNPKRVSTTEAGSPVAFPAKRQPLGFKSPNTSSPHKGKRKLEADIDESTTSPCKAAARPSPEEAHCVASGKKTRAVDLDAEDELTAPTVPAEAALELVDQVDGQEGGPGHGRKTRRSSRIRGQAKSATLKSSIPTAIKISHSGLGRNSSGTMKSSVQKDISKATSLNTRRNRGEDPTLVLARISEALSGRANDDAFEKHASDRGKSVGWKDPLESVQDEKANQRKIGSQTKAPQKMTAATRKTVATASRQKPRAANVSRELGMTGNGTPGRPQRVTRSRSRKD